MEVPAPPPTPDLAAAFGRMPVGCPRGRSRIAGVRSNCAAVEDLFAPRAAVYWADLIVSAACFYGGFALAATASRRPVAALAAAALSVLALYRAVIFIHSWRICRPGAYRGSARLGPALRHAASRARISLWVACRSSSPPFLWYGGDDAPWGSPGRARRSVLRSASWRCRSRRCGLCLGPAVPTSPALRRWVAVNASSGGGHAIPACRSVAGGSAPLASQGRPFRLLSRRVGKAPRRDRTAGTAISDH